MDPGTRTYYNKVGGNLCTGSNFGLAPSTMHNSSSIESCLMQYLCPQVAKRSQSLGPGMAVCSHILTVIFRGHSSSSPGVQVVLRGHQCCYIHYDIIYASHT